MTSNWVENQDTDDSFLYHLSNSAKHISPSVKMVILQRRMSSYGETYAMNFRNWCLNVNLSNSFSVFMFIWRGLQKLIVKKNWFCLLLFMICFFFFFGVSVPMFSFCRDGIIPFIKDNFQYFFFISPNSLNNTKHKKTNCFKKMVLIPFIKMWHKKHNMEYHFFLTQISFLFHLWFFEWELKKRKNNENDFKWRLKMQFFIEVFVVLSLSLWMNDIWS